MTSVVMLVANDVTHDSRVQKEALALARTGLTVTVLGVAPGPQRSVSMLGPVRILLLPVPYRLRDEWNRRRLRRRNLRLPLVMYGSDEQAQAARLHLEIAERQHQAALGRALPEDQSRRPGSAGRSQSARELAGPPRLRALRQADRARSTITDAWRQGLASAWARYDEWSARVPSGARWRALHPEVFDLELAFGPVLDRLRPAIIHAHDMHTLGIAADAVARARQRGRRVRWIYDAHEYVPGLSQYGGRTPRAIAGWADLEAEYIRDAARVLTVGTEIAEALQSRYGLPRRPAVVLNAAVPAALDAGAPDLRTVAQIPQDAPLILYSGGITPARGVQTAIEALRVLPEARLALVCVPHTTSYFVRGMRSLAAEVGVADRVSFLNPVEPPQVVQFLRSADVGLIPTLAHPSHDMALPNKLFEYLHAGVPVVVSDCKAQAAFVREHGIGEVFAAGDPGGLAAALRTVLADRERYATVARDPVLREQYSWPRQEEVLRELYSDLLRRPLRGGRSDADAVASERPSRRPPSHPVLALGPGTGSGQTALLAQAVQRTWHLPTAVVALGPPSARATADRRSVDRATYQRSVSWQLDTVAWLLGTSTHVLLEGGDPIFGWLLGRTFDADVSTLRAAGLTTGLLLHAESFAKPERQFRAAVAAYDGPTFVSSPELLAGVPGARWLPYVVDVDGMDAAGPPLAGGRPVVLTGPQSGAAAAAVDSALAELEGAGLIERRWLPDLDVHPAGPDVGGADVVVDDLSRGCYSLLGAQALAAGRVVVASLTDEARRHFPVEPPLAATDTSGLADTLRRLLADRDTARALAAEGPRFAATLHAGRRAASELGSFLGMSTSAGDAG